jgi:transposase
MQMKGKRRAHSDKFKAKIAIEALKGIKTLVELATEHKIHPNQITTWKKQLLMNAEELFSRGKASKSKTEELTTQLYEEIGRLKMDIKWLEKKL